MWEKLILIVCSALADLMANLLSFFVDVILISYNLLPTDPISGLLDIGKEPFVAFLPYINWFIPLDYAVTLVGAILDAYGLYVCWKYLKKILYSVLAYRKNLIGMLAYLIK